MLLRYLNLFFFKITKLLFIKTINSPSKIFKKFIYSPILGISVILKKYSENKSKILGISVIFKNIRGWINNFYNG